MSCSCEIDALEEIEELCLDECNQDDELVINEKDSELDAFIDFFFKTMDTGEVVYLSIDIIMDDKNKNKNKIARHQHVGKYLNSVYYLDHTLNTNTMSTSSSNYHIEEYKYGLLYEIKKLNNHLTTNKTIVSYSLSTSTVNDIATFEY